MAPQGKTTLGLLELDEGLSADSSVLAPREGALSNPSTFGVSIITEMVEGAYADVVIRGDSSLETASIAAAQRLAARGASAIAGDCGFLIRHQAAIAAAVNVPVVTSSLLLVPALLRQLAPASKLAVITADSQHCSHDLFSLENPADKARVIVGGIEGGEYIRNTLARPFIRTDVNQIEREVGDCIARLRTDHPEIAALVFECTGFPVVTSAIRRTTGLPIYDITDLCRMTLSVVTSRTSA
ncbi:hypothetical protein NXC12_PD00197 (plasmid) [Rhizobium etli]|uniref:Asp/Glu/hydantoin racemase n=1 Tax=Rhizobium etli TaxID=29449 RepID=A0AAN1BLN7_RHIET|nr:hypothetical protein [Rhizobium etli]ARQ13296.1 hypothetical protein NXC12_PD00197 [Rhizobium etli]